MDGFGGGFGLPDLSLGKSKKELNQGFNRATNLLKNAGEEADDLIIGHSNKNRNNGLSIGVPGFGGISLDKGKQHGRGLSLDANLNGIGGDLNKAGNVLEKNADDTIDYVLGKERNGFPTGTKPKVSLPSLSFGGGNLPGIPAVGKEVNNFGKNFNKIGSDLNEAGNVLEKKGEETIDYFLGKEKNGYSTASTRIPNLSITGFGGVKPPNLSITGFGSVKPPNFPDTGKKVNGDIVKIGGHLGKIDNNLGKIGFNMEKTGGKVLNKIFSGRNTTSQGLSTGGTNEMKSTQSSISVSGNKMDKGVGITKINSTSNSTPLLGTTLSNSRVTTISHGATTSLSGTTTSTSSKITSSSGTTTSTSGAATSPFGATTRLSGATTSTYGATTRTSGVTTNLSGATTNLSGATTNLSGATTSPSGMNTNSSKTSSTTLETTTSISGLITPLKALGVTTKMQESLGKSSPGQPPLNQNGITEKLSTVGLNPTTSNPTSFEISTDDVSELPEKTSIKSEEALRKIESILQGSGKETTTSAAIVTQGNTKVTDSTTSTSTKSGPAILPPYYKVPNAKNNIGEDFTPELPPTVFDKPTGKKAPFIPILPSSMVTTPENPAGPPNRGLNTSAPQAPPSENLTPLEYTSIGVGVVLIITFITYLYKQYRKRVNKRSSGSYSPNSSHKDTPDRRRSTNSEGGQPQEVKEADKYISTPGGANRIDPEVVVVEITPEVRPVEEVVEAPITKTVVNNLQRSAPTEDRQAVLTAETPDSVEVISETKSPMEKPPRRAKTPPNSPEKFTSDKTSASNLNENSLKTVGQAIGGILKNQEPNRNGTEHQPNEESSGDSGEEGVSLLGKLVEAQSSKNLPKNTDSPPVTKNEMPVQAGNSENEPLYRSIENEVDAGSEYYSADESPDNKTSPPMSPLPEKKFGNVDMKNLRAQDVYNTEIVSEDGRRRSLEEDIAESIKKNDNPLNEDTVQNPSTSQVEHNASCVNEALPVTQPSSEVVPPGSQTSNKSADFVNNRNLPEEIHIKNMINSEKSASEKFQKEEAEVIVDNIIRTSCLDQVTIETIQQDLGNPETSSGSTPRVTFSDNPQIQIYADENKPVSNIRSGNFLEDIIHTEEPETCQPNNRNIVRNSNVEVIEPNQPTIQEPVSVKVDFQGSVLGTPYGPVFGKEIHVENIAITKNEEETPPTTINSDGNIQPESTPNINNQTHQTGSLVQTNNSVDEGCVVDQRFECIPPKQPQIFEDDLIVFSNSNRELSPTPVSISEGRSIPTILSAQVGNDDSLVSFQEFIAGNSGVSKNTGQNNETSQEQENNEMSPQHNPAKWYVPDDTSEPGLIEVENKTAEGLYIVLSDEKPLISGPIEPAATANSLNALDSTGNGLLNQPKTEKRVHSNISYAYIDVHDDPINEGWPKHLPENIHSVSGVGLVKTADASSSVYSVLKEEEGEMNPSTSTSFSEDSKKETINTLERIPAEGPSGTKQKPIPEFIIPNMDKRLSKKRMSKRRQIKSLDSGVHHYYGEYLSLAELPEHESEHVEKKADDINKTNNDSGVIEEVLTIKPDGTITEEKIVIQNHKNGSHQ